MSNRGLFKSCFQGFLSGNKASIHYDKDADSARKNSQIDCNAGDESLMKVEVSCGNKATPSCFSFREVQYRHNVK